MDKIGDVKSSLTPAQTGKAQPASKGGRPTAPPEDRVQISGKGSKPSAFQKIKDFAKETAKGLSRGKGSAPSGKGSAPSRPSGKGSAPANKPSGKGSSPSNKPSAPSGKGSGVSGKGSKPACKPTKPSGKGAAPSGKGSRFAKASTSIQGEGLFTNDQVLRAMDSWRNTIK